MRDFHSLEKVKIHKYGKVIVVLEDHQTFSDLLGSTIQVLGGEMKEPARNISLDTELDYSHRIFDL